MWSRGVLTYICLICGIYAFLDSPHTNNDRIYKLLKSIYYSTIRVENNIDFAIRPFKTIMLSVRQRVCYGRNTLSVFERPDRFSEKGLKYLEQEGLKQIYEDGSSFNIQQTIID